MNAAQIRRRCQRRLAELEPRLVLPQPFDVAELTRSVGTLLGQRIELIALPMTVGAPYGITLFTADVQFIAYEQRTSRLHQDHIVAHELGHLLLGHLGVDLDTDQAVAELFPTLSPRLVGRVLDRSGVYTEIEEYEAETMATLLLQHGARPLDPNTDEPPLQQADALARLRASLERRTR